MSNLKVRIGIDVGGTFTDAIIINNENGELIAKEKTPTTHYSDQGVASGIIYLITKLMKEHDICADDVVFIAHGTTQATNALLEGDVASVGLIGIGEGIVAKNEVKIEKIELAPNKYLNVENVYFKQNDLTMEKIKATVKMFKEKEINVAVVSQAYSVDEPVNEDIITNLCKDEGLYSTSGHEISQLYGLKTRTRTAVVNGSLIPKMLETANLTQDVVKEVGINSQLMIMRADGGVMSVDEMRQRPILTMLSGLAAGVAGVLMYEKLTDGIFLEAGGTSTDISVIKDGKVMIKSAQVGGHKTYINSLDVRTLAVAGGSMIRINNKEVIDVGPRSAHLAKLGYECFSSTNDFNNATIDFIAPLSGDPQNYAVIKNQEGKIFSFTLAGAVNVLGYISCDDYAFAKQEINLQAWTILAQHLNTSVEVLAKKVVDIACEKIWKVVEPMIIEYELESDFITLVGGGGSASVITKPLAQKYRYKHKIAKNAPYISTIGVAMAMLREEIEKSIINPSNEDIKKLRNEIFEKIVASGACEQSIEITISVDSSKNKVSAVATGSSDFKVKEFKTQKLTLTQKKSIVANGLNINENEIKEIQNCGKWTIMGCASTNSKMFGLIKHKVKRCALINDEGVIVLRKNNCFFKKCHKSSAAKTLETMIETYSTYSDAGQSIPKIYLLTPNRLHDYSGLIAKDQVNSIFDLDLKYLDEHSDICILAIPK